MGWLTWTYSNRIRLLFFAKSIGSTGLFQTSLKPALCISPTYLMKIDFCVLTLYGQKHKAKDVFNLIILSFYFPLARLASLMYAMFRTYTSYISNRAFTKTDNSIRHWIATISHIQLMIGFTLYFISPIVKCFSTQKRRNSASWHCLFWQYPYLYDTRCSGCHYHRLGII